MGKFSLQNACGVGKTVKAPAQQAHAALPPLPLRVADVTVYKRATRAPRMNKAPRIYKTALKQNANKQKTLSRAPSAPLGDEHSSRNKSILSLLLRGAPSEDTVEAESQRPRQPKERIGDAAAYIKDVMREPSKHLPDHGLWIAPPSASKVAAEINEQRKRSSEQMLDAGELLNLCTRPSIFVWDPMALHHGLSISCPKCGLPASRSNWCSSRPIQRLHGNSVYITRRYGCYACGKTPGQKKPSTRAMKRFLADAPEVLASLPSAVRSQWQFTNTGRSLCDAPMIDLIRAMATKTSWSAIANAINDMTSAAWVREVQMPYVRLCEAVNVAALPQESDCPMELRVTDKCIKNMYMKDFALRQEGVATLAMSELCPGCSGMRAAMLNFCAQGNSSLSFLSRHLARIRLLSVLCSYRAQIETGALPMWARPATRTPKPPEAFEPQESF